MEDDDGAAPDDFFTAEFDKGDLARRLWRGGLRASSAGYTIDKPVHVLTDSLSNGLDRPGSSKATALVDTIETSWNDAARLRRACDPLQGDSVANEMNSPSLVRVLLCIESLQTPLATCIINKISEFGEDAQRQDALAPLLLSQLKWLDFLVDSPTLCGNLLEIVPIVSPQMQRNIVESLPEILDDRSRDTAVTDLMRILEENPAMMGSVVDALGALGVRNDAVQDVNGAVLATLSAANPDMLPASLRYLMRTAPPVLYDATVTAMRSTLAHSGLGPGAGRLCLDALRNGFRVNKNIADHALKTLRKIEKPRDHRHADIWIILALLDSPAHRKMAEVLFRKKAAVNAFSLGVLDAALAPFAESFTDLHDRLICLGAITIKAAEPSARKTGVGLYALLFKLFKFGNARRNIIGALLEHTGSRRPNEVDSALEALVTIAREGEELRSLLPYTASIQGLLDFLEAFSDAQLRQIWCLLALLCRSAITPSSGGRSKSKSTKSKSVVNDSEDEEEDEELDEEDDVFDGGGNQSETSMLEILIRKELTHVDMSYRRIGVLGACTMIKILGSNIQSNIFQMLFDAGRAQAFTQALAFDELANVLPRGDTVEKQSVVHISNRISESFESTYLGDASLPEDDEEPDGFPESYLYANYDGPECEVCIPIYRLILKHRSTTQGSLNIIRPLGPGLRLLCILTSLRYKGQLGEIDAVIGAPIRMPRVSDGAEFSRLPFPAKKHVLLALFAAHAWLVELINGFATQKNPELRGKCIRRLENLIEMEDMLGVCTARFPSWPSALFDAYQNVESLRDHPILKEKPSGKGRKSAAAAESEGGDGVGGKSMVWKNCARKLDPCALALLKITNPIQYTSTDYETQQEGDTVKTKKHKTELDAKGLQYLLQQLLETIVDNIRQDMARGAGKNNSLAFLSLQVGSVGGTRKAAASGGPLNGGVTSAVEPLQALLELKPAITALAAQLYRSLRRFGDDAFVDGEEVDFVSMGQFKNSAIMCLQCMAGTLSSSNLKDASAQEFLFDVLASICFNTQQILPSDPLTSTDIYVAAKTAFSALRKKFLDMAKIDPETAEDDIPANDGVTNLGMEGSAAFLAALESTLGFCSDADSGVLGKRLSDVAGGILERRWGIEVMKSKRTLKLLPGIVQMFVQYSSEPIEVLTKLRERLSAFSEYQKALNKKTAESQQAAESISQENLHKNWGSLTAHSYHVYCTGVFEQYIAMFKKFKPSESQNTEEALGELLQFVEGIIPLFNLAKANEKVLTPAMKAGRGFVEQYIKTCIPYLKDKFLTYQTYVLKVFKVQQKLTRILQVFCSHSKGLRDSGLTALVPPLRRALELLLYRVKEMMQSHDQVGAYTLGNLKNKDINGAIVSSQDQYRSESEVSESDMDEDEENEDEDEDQTTPKTKGRSQREIQVQRDKKAAKRKRGLLGTPEKKKASSKDNSFATTATRPASSLSKNSAASKRSGKRAQPTLDESDSAGPADVTVDADEEEMDEDAPITRAFDEEEADDTPIVRKRKKSRRPVHEDEDVDTPVLPKRKKKKKRTPDTARTKKRKEREVRAMIDDEADEDHRDEEDLDEAGSLDEFIVDSEEITSQL